jgi:restriction system protein
MKQPHDPIASVIEHWRMRDAQVSAIAAAETVHVTDAATLEVASSASAKFVGEDGTSAVEYPAVLVQVEVVTFGNRTSEGQLIEGVSVAWFEIIKQLQRDPQFLYNIHWRKLEEIIAGAYEQEGWPEVVLTPRSGDQGRDVIATRPGVGSIRIIDQVKAYSPTHLVTADEVRSLLGVLSEHRNVSKGVITTSSGFAPGITKEATLTVFMPHRLELKDGKDLRQWLIDISSKKSDNFAMGRKQVSEE